jgi:ABC-2 type transport system permease protein
MRASGLFRRRLFEELGYQWGVMKSVLDWTIVVYLVIPMLVASPFVYADMWQNSHLYWSGKLPLGVLFVLLLLLTASGNYRTYLMEADLLYLLQKKELLYPFKQMGFLFSLIGSVFQVGVAGVITLPLFVEVYGMGMAEIVSMLAVVLAVQLLFMTVKKFTTRVFLKLALFGLMAAAATVLTTEAPPLASGILSISVAGSIIFYHLGQTTKSDRWFMREIEIEERERVRYIKLILTYSMEVEKEPVNQRSRPLVMFRKSQRFFKKVKGRSKEDGLLELLVKGFLRRNYLTLYVQMFLLTISAVIVLPMWLKWIVFAGFAFFIHSWLKSLFRKMLDSPFFTIVPYDKAAADSVWIRFKKLFAFPVIGLAGTLAVILTIIELIGWIG